MLGKHFMSCEIAQYRFFNFNKFENLQRKEIATWFVVKEWKEDDLVLVFVLHTLLFTSNVIIFVAIKHYCCINDFNKNIALKNLKNVFTKNIQRVRKKMA